jgi:hypothetical protein
LWVVGCQWSVVIRQLSFVNRHPSFHNRHSLWSVVSGGLLVGRGQWSVVRCQWLLVVTHCSPLITQHSALVSLFARFVEGEELSTAADNQQDPDQIKAKVNERNHRSKVFDGFDLGHHLGYAVEHAQSGQNEKCAPNQLNGRPLPGHGLSFQAARE